MRLQIQNKSKQTPAYRAGFDSDSTANLKKKIAEGEDDILEPIFTGVDSPQNTSKQTSETPGKPKEHVVRKTPTVIQVEKPKRIVKRVGTPSIKMALKGEFKGEEKQLSAKEQHKMYSKADETEVFTEEQLIEKWRAYFEIFIISHELGWSHASEMFEIMLRSHTVQ